MRYVLVALVLMGLVSACSQNDETKALAAQIEALQQQIITLEQSVQRINKLGNFESISLDQAGISDEALLRWATASLIQTYSYHFLNYQQVITQIRPLFTSSGYNAYLKALQASKTLEAIREKKLVVNALPIEGAQIVKQGVRDGVYWWEVALPIMVTYQNVEQAFQQSIQVHLKIVRDSSTPLGIAIHEINATVAGRTSPVVVNATSSGT